MKTPLLLLYYQEMSNRTRRSKSGKLRRTDIGAFQRKVQARYNEATLEKLLNCADVDVRQAAALALGLLGGMSVNAALADRLGDEDPTVRDLAGDAMWSIWFRADTAENNAELQRLMGRTLTASAAPEVLAGYAALIARAPTFAEAYNQRAIVLFRLGEFAQSIADCDKALRLNPYHFGAASGMAQCYVKQKKFRAALRSYRRACRIHPHLDGVKQVIDSIERMLGEEGKR